MTWLRVMALRIRGMFAKRRLDAELDEELRAHLEMLTEENMQRGMSAEEARRAAKITLGGAEQIKEAVRDQRGLPLLESLVTDVRFGLRMLRKNPGFTATAILTLALGIGANTAIFSLVDAVILRMLPVQHPQELLKIVPSSPTSSGAGTGIGPGSLTNPMWEALRDRQDVFAGAFVWGHARFDLAQGGEASYADGLYVSGDYFRTLGIQPAAGRLLTASDDFRGCPHVAVLSYGFWQSHFGSEQSAIGSAVRLDNQPFQIIGVSARGFFGTEVGNKFDVAAPVCSSAVASSGISSLDARNSSWLRAMGRIKPGINARQADARLESLSPSIFAASVPLDWKQEYQYSFMARRFSTSPGATGLSNLRNRYDQPLLALMMVVGLVLLIACRNIGSLLLARATGRKQEVAVRRALGASRWRIVRQLLTECALLSLAGALLGLFLARWADTLLVRIIGTSRQTVSLDLVLDWRILGFTAAIAVLTVVLFGVLPAALATRVSLISAMKGPHAEEADRRGRFRAARLIVAGQVALSLVLLMVAGLVLRSFEKLLTEDLGFTRTGVLIVNVNAVGTHLPQAQLLPLYEQMLERLRGLPGVAFASQSVVTPLSGAGWNNLIYADVPHPLAGMDAFADLNCVSPDYFATMRTPLLSGRAFTPDDSAGSPPVVIVNQTLARKFFPGRDALGRYFSMESPPEPGAKFLVVGVVKDAKYNSVREDVPPTAYLPIAQIGGAPQNISFELRTPLNPSAIESAAVGAITSVDTSLLVQFRTLEDQVDDSLTQDRLLAILSSFFGGLAVLLVAIGLYGVVGYLVARLTHEIGIRMALGAQQKNILRLVLREGMGITLLGMVIGVFAGFAATRVMATMLYGVTATDPLTFMGVAIVLALVALTACYIPARRAARVDPMVALRHE